MPPTRHRSIERRLLGYYSWTGHEYPSWGLRLGPRRLCVNLEHARRETIVAGRLAIWVLDLAFHLWHPDAL